MNTQSLAVIAPTEPAPVSMGTLTAATPAALVAGASEMAGTLASVIRAQGLATRIQGREYVQVEGWTTLATMLGVTAREVSTVENDGIYTATVELSRMSDGAIISRASAECGEEKPWNSRPRYARRSMAQTRATGKACRLAFSWIMRLAGYEPTPAEEMEPITAAPVPPPVPSGAPQPARQIEAPITALQQADLVARITSLGLEQGRVLRWVNRAWGCQGLDQVPASRNAELLARLEAWAQAERSTWLGEYEGGRP